MNPTDVEGPVVLIGNWGGEAMVFASVAEALREAEPEDVDNGYWCDAFEPSGRRLRLFAEGRKVRIERDPGASSSPEALIEALRFVLRVLSESSSLRHDFSRAMIDRYTLPELLRIVERECS